MKKLLAATVILGTSCFFSSLRAEPPLAVQKSTLPFNDVSISYEPKIVHVGKPVTFTCHVDGAERAEHGYGLRWVGTGVLKDEASHSLDDKDIWIDGKSHPTFTYTTPGKKGIELYVCPSNSRLAMTAVVEIEVLP